VAIRDIGLKPWEFEAMTLQQYVDYAEGVKIRIAKEQEPHRLIYWVLRAVNSKKAVSYSEVKKEWPLYTDRLHKPKIQDMRDRWNNLKALQQAIDEPGSV
jgi:hypothetical protein